MVRLILSLSLEACDMFKYQSSFLFHFQVKPARAGSSIGVKVAYGVLDSLTKADEIISEVCWFSWDLTVRLDQKFANLIENVLKLTWKWHFLFWNFKGKHVNWSICIEMNWKFSIMKSKFFFSQNFGLENPPHNTFYLLKIFSLQSLIGNWWQSPYWNISWRREWVYSHCPGCGVWFGLPSCCAIANWGMSSFNVYFPQINFPYHLSQWDPA